MRINWRPLLRQTIARPPVDMAWPSWRPCLASIAAAADCLLPVAAPSPHGRCLQQSYGTPYRAPHVPLQDATQAPTGTGFGRVWLDPVTVRLTGPASWMWGVWGGVRLSHLLKMKEGPGRRRRRARGRTQDASALHFHFTSPSLHFASHRLHSLLSSLWTRLCTRSPRLELPFLDVPRLALKRCAEHLVPGPQPRRGYTQTAIARQTTSTVFTASRPRANLTACAHISRDIASKGLLSSLLLCSSSDPRSNTRIAFVTIQVNKSPPATSRRHTCKTAKQQQ